MSLRSKRKRRLAWLKKKEADNYRIRNPVVEQAIPDTRGTTPVDLSQYHDLTVDMHLQPTRIESNQTFRSTIVWPDRSGLHAESVEITPLSVSNGSIENPYGTISEAVASAQPGQTIWVQPSAALRPLRQPLYDTNEIPSPIYLSSAIIRLLSENKGDIDIPEYIKQLVEAEIQRKKPFEAVKPAIRHLDLED